METLSVELTPAQARALLKHLKRTINDDHADNKDLMMAVFRVEMAIHPPKSARA